MKYVVVRPANGLAKIYILEEGEQVATPFESWALRTGPQILFATTKMHKVLHSQHMLGSYETGAMYAYSYEELCAIIAGSLGPSDRQRYEAGLKESFDQTSIKGISKRDSSKLNWGRIGYITWKVFEFTVWLMIKILKLLGLVILIPILVGWINRVGKH